MCRIFPVIILLAFTGSLHAETSDTSNFDPVDQAWMLQGGFELDDEGGYALSSGVMYQHSSRTYVALDLGLSDSSLNLARFRTTMASLRLDHSLGPVGGSLSLGWAEDDGFVTRFRYGGSLYFQAKGFYLEILGEAWNSDFDTIEFSTTLKRDPPLRPVVLTVTSNCDLDNTAFGGQASYTTGAWSIYAAATNYDYSRADCDFTGMLGDIDLRNPPDALARFAPLFFRRLAVATASRIVNTDAAFLDNSYSAGLSFRIGEKSLTFDYFHSKEVFEQFAADTVVAGILFPVSYRGDLELHLGATDHEFSDVVGFIGATVYWYLN